jgi:hypothetical protein
MKWEGKPRFGVQRRLAKTLLPTVLTLIALTTTARAGAAEFTNTTPLLIPAASACCSAQAASLYPSSIEVSGLSGITTAVAVTLHEMSDNDAEDLAVLLVGPNGHGVVLMASYEQGRHDHFNDTTWTFETFAQRIGCPEPEGSFPTVTTFAPFDCGLSTPFPAPAPQESYGGALEALGNSGVWSIYVDNAAGGQEGRIAGGWSLQVDTHPWPTPPGETSSQSSPRPAVEAPGTKASERAANGEGERTTHTQTTTRCIVPRLVGDRLPAARRALAHAHCTLGKVRRRHSHNGTLIVARQEFKAGTRLARRTPIGVTLAPAKKRRYRRGPSPST